jgi:hypothetical protein
VGHNIYIVYYIYNLVLTRPGVNIIESEFDLKEYREYFILEHSEYRIPKTVNNNVLSRVYIICRNVVSKSNPLL